MPREREDISELLVRSTPSNVRKALNLRVTKPEPSLAKREELEKLFTEARAEYERAADDVRIRGSVITVTKYTSKGKAFDTEVVNPYFKVMRGLAQQMSQLAKLLSKFERAKTNDVIPGSAAAMFPELFSKEQVS